MSNFLNSQMDTTEQLLDEFNDLNITNIIMPNVNIFNEINYDNIHVIIDDPDVEQGYESPTPTGPPSKPPSIKEERKNARKQLSRKRRRSSSI
jgi:hypothetical protein